MDRWNLERTALWGLATRESFIDPTAIDALVQKEMGRQAGAKQTLSHFRDKFGHRTFVRDKHDIP